MPDLNDMALARLRAQQAEAADASRRSEQEYQSKAAHGRAELSRGITALLNRLNELGGPDATQFNRTSEVRGRFKTRQESRPTAAWFIFRYQENTEPWDSADYFLLPDGNFISRFSSTVYSPSDLSASHVALAIRGISDLLEKYK